MGIPLCVICCFPLAVFSICSYREAWRAAIHGVAKSQTRLSDFTFTFHFPALEKEMATLVGLHRTVQLQLLQHYWSGDRLGLL